MNIRASSVQAKNAHSLSFTFPTMALPHMLCGENPPSAVKRLVIAAKASFQGASFRRQEEFAFSTFKILQEGRELLGSRGSNFASRAHAMGREFLL